jgi:L-rhamnose mutarotase
MSQIGKVIDKPDVSKYKGRKKIYFVRNLYLPKNATDEYKLIHNRYWSEVEEHLGKLEAAGKISKIFCESIYLTGKEAMKVIASMNARLEKIVNKKIKDGAELLPLESREIFEVYIDWYNCLMHVRTSEVYEKIQELLDAEIKKRFQHIKSVLQEHIADAEAGLLIMREEDREHLELPDDIVPFFVTPPAYDDLLAFLRERDSGKEYWRS